MAMEFKPLITLLAVANPLAIPLLTGPATMSTVVIYAEKASFAGQLASSVHSSQ